MTEEHDCVPVRTSNGQNSGLVLEVELSADQLAHVASMAAGLLDDREQGPEPWVGVDDAAAHLACPRSRVYALVSADRIPHERDGSRLLFKVSELDRWVRDGGAKRP
jgi:excisionase family DNA binding protein